MSGGLIKGIVVEIGGDTSGLQKALSKVNSSTFSLGKELRGINSLLKFDPSNTELLNQKQQVLRENIEETSKKLKILKETQKQADEAIKQGTKISEENYRNLQREIINTETKLKQLQVQSSKWTTAGRSIEEFGDKVTKISGKLDSLGNTLTTSLTLPVLAIGTAAITTGNDFEAQMSRVQAIAGATENELNKLTDQAVKLGAETSFSATEAAAGMENLASAGFSTNEIIEAMPGLLDLAASSGSELATASEIAASSIRGFGLEASQSAHLADVFAEASAKTNAQVEDMGEAMKYVAPVAKTVGITIEETAAAIGIMSDAGIKGSQAGTTLRSGLVRIVKPTKQVKDAMEELGVEFYNSDGKMKSLTEIVETLQKSTAGLTDETKNQALAQIFGTEALSGMLALVNRGPKELNDMTRSFEECDGAAKKMADTILNNNKGALESLSGSLESAGIAIQQALSPEIKKLSKWIQGLVDDFNNLSKEQQLNVIKTVSLAAAIGPAIKILSKLGISIGKASKTIGIFSQAVAVATNKTTSNKKAVNDMANSLKAVVSPAGVATTSIALYAAGVAVVTARVKEEMQSIKDLTTEIKGSIEARNSALETINNQQSASLSEISNVQVLKDELSKLVDENGRVKEGYESRVNFILTELNKALGTEYEMNQNIVKSYKEMQGSIDELILKKKTQIILEANEEKYKEAIQNKNKAYEDYLETQKKINEILPEYKRLLEDANNGWIGSSEGLVQGTTKLKEYDKQLEELTSTLEKQDKQLQEYSNAIITYENNSELMIEGGAENLKKIEQSVANTQTNITSNANSELNRRIQDQIEANKKSKELYDLEAKYNKDVKNSIYAENVKQGEKNLKLLVEELIARTSTIGQLGQNEILAWRYLGQNSFEEYKTALEKMEPTMQLEIQKATGIIINDTTFTSAIEAKTNEMNQTFESKLRLSGKTEEEIKEITSRLTGDTKVESAAGMLGTRAKNSFERNANGEQSGINYVEGATRGINNKVAQSALFGALTSLGISMNNTFNRSLGEHSPSKITEQSGINYVKGSVIGIKKQRRSLLLEISKLGRDAINEFDMLEKNDLLKIGGIQNRLESKIIERTKTIYTTPTLNIYTNDELTPVKIRSIINEVDKILGSKYS